MPHLHEKIDFTAEVFIVFKEKVLLRKHDKYGLWLSVGGHIEDAEDPNEAALREVREEVGLDVKLAQPDRTPLAPQEGYTELIPPQFMNRHRINPTHEHVTLIFFAQAETDKLHLSTSEASEECRWFSRSEIASSDEIKEHIKRYALAALDALK